MSENKKIYPKVIVGAFIFNDKGELFLMKSPKWSNCYVCPGGRIEVGESLEAALAREIKEETSLDLKDIEFITVLDGLDLKEYKKEDNHLIFLNYQAKAKRTDKIRLNDEATEYKWLKLEEWAKERNVNRHTMVTIEKLMNVPDNFEEKYKRALADYQNLLKRTAREKQEFAKYANEELIRQIIPVYDNLKLALIHAEESENNNNIVTGVQHILSQFKDILISLGVEEIKVKAGDKFDHHTMEVLEGQGERIKQVVKPGYKLNGKVIEAAKVVVE